RAGLAPAGAHAGRHRRPPPRDLLGRLLRRPAGRGARGRHPGRRRGRAPRRPRRGRRGVPLCRGTRNARPRRAPVPDRGRRRGARRRPDQGRRPRRTAHSAVPAPSRRDAPQWTPQWTEVDPAVRIERLRWWHIEELLPIEADLFGVEKWSAGMFWNELANGHHYLVALDGDGSVLGYAGLSFTPPYEAWVQ